MHGLRHRSAPTHMLRLWVRIPPGLRMFVLSVLCCQVDISAMSWSLIQTSSADWSIVLCDIRRNISRMKRPWPVLGYSATEKKSLQHKSIVVVLEMNKWVLKSHILGRLVHQHTAENMACIIAFRTYDWVLRSH
jgi:hypothetical protein